MNASTSTAILHVLRSRNQHMTCSELQEVLGGNPMTVRSSLCKLVQRKELIPCGHRKREGRVQPETIYKPAHLHPTGQQLKTERAALMRRLHHITDAASLATLRNIIQTVEDMQ